MWLLQIRQLKSKLLSQSKQRKFDGQVFEADEADVAADLAPPLNMAPKTESAAGAAVQDPQEQQKQQDYQQISTATPVTTLNHESPVKSKGGASTSSESNSSEIMNADSPRPIDSGVSPSIDQKSNYVCSQVPSATTQAADNVDTSLVQFAEDLCGGRLVAPQPFQRIAVKVEDGVMSLNTLQEECSNYFYTMDDGGNLPWWEWP